MREWEQRDLEKQRGGGEGDSREKDLVWAIVVIT